MLFSFSITAQVQPNPRQVLGSTGGTGTAPWGTVDYTVGEVMTETYTQGSPFVIKTVTQGFQQPNSVAGTLSVTQASVNSTCIGGNNGSVALTPLNAVGNVTYTWNPAIVGDTNVASNLPPGTYQYTISDSLSMISGTVVVTEDQVECISILCNFYNGITPNGDGNNDTWVIDCVADFPENTVSIYNRWGDLIWVGKNYDNTTVVWDGKNKNGNRMTDATYFYLVEVGDKKFKGWIELTN